MQFVQREDVILEQKGRCLRWASDTNMRTPTHHHHPRGNLGTGKRERAEKGKGEKEKNKEVCV